MINYAPSYIIHQHYDKILKLCNEKLAGKYSLYRNTWNQSNVVYTRKFFVSVTVGSFYINPDQDKIEIFVKDEKIAREINDLLETHIVCNVEIYVD